MHIVPSLAFTMPKMIAISLNIDFCFFKMTYLIIFLNDFIIHVMATSKCFAVIKYALINTTQNVSLDACFFF